jgi:hypothetical protein
MMEHEKWGNKIWEEMKMHAFRNYNGPCQQPPQASCKFREHVLAKHMFYLFIVDKPHLQNGPGHNTLLQQVGLSDNQQDLKSSNLKNC